MAKAHEKGLFISILFISVILNTMISQTVESEPMLKMGLVARIECGGCKLGVDGFRAFFNNKRAGTGNLSKKIRF